MGWPRAQVPLRLQRTADACAAFGARWFVRGRRRMRGTCTWGDADAGICSVPCALERHWVDNELNRLNMYHSAFIES